MGDQLNALTTTFTEFYYWVTIVMMFLIHVGFCTYEVGVSRRRNHLKTLMKNAMAIPLDGRTRSDDRSTGRSTGPGGQPPPEPLPCADRHLLVTVDTSRSSQRGAPERRDRRGERAEGDGRLENRGPEAPQADP